MKQQSKIGAGLTLVLAVALLAGCSGSSDDNNNNGVTPPNPGPGPVTPVATVDPSIALVRQLVSQGDNNTAEPAVLSNRAFGTTDTTEPEAI